MLMRCLIVAALLLVPFVRASGAEPAAEPAWLMAPERQPSQQPETYFMRHYARVERSMIILPQEYTLEDMRERDTLRLAGPTPGSPASTVTGAGLFSTLVVGAAHTPPFLHFAFDGALHVGPTLFDGGGMGAGFGGRL